MFVYCFRETGPSGVPPSSAPTNAVASSSSSQRRNAILVSNRQVQFLCSGCIVMEKSKFDGSCVYLKVLSNAFELNQMMIVVFLLTISLRCNFAYFGSMVLIEWLLG